MEGYDRLITTLTDSWWQKACTESGQLYLIGRRSSKEGYGEMWVMMRVGYETRKGEQYVRPEPLSKGLTREHFAALLRTWLNREPLWVLT